MKNYPSNRTPGGANLGGKVSFGPAFSNGDAEEADEELRDEEGGVHENVALRRRSLG